MEGIEFTLSSWRKRPRNVLEKRRWNVDLSQECNLWVSAVMARKHWLDISILCYGVCKAASWDDSAQMTAVSIRIIGFSNSLQWHTRSVTVVRSRGPIFWKILWRIYDRKIVITSS